MNQIIRPIQIRIRLLMLKVVYQSIRGTIFLPPKIEATRQLYIKPSKEL